MRIVPQSVQLLHFTANAPGLMEEAGKTCRKADCGVGTAAKFLRGIFKAGHHTILEHASATFRVVCSRGVSHEFVRHRHMVFSQESTRFCDYTREKHDNEIKVVCPPFADPEDRADFIAAAEFTEARYQRMRARGCPPEFARGALVTDLKTEFVVTANLREWCLFLRQRYYGLTGKPHPMMLEVAAEIQRLLLAACPEVFEALDREARHISLTDRLIAKVRDLCGHLNQPEANNDLLDIASIYEDYQEVA